MSRPTRKRAGALRVVAGDLRGRRFDAPPGTGTRPTSDRVRQATFNALESMGAVHGAVAIDAFAGSGALGIEALSRGASSCLFVEESAEGRALIRDNVEALGLQGRTRIFRRDATDLGDAGTIMPFTLLFADPPYGKGLGEKALAAARNGGWLRPNAFCIVEETSAAAFDAGAGFTLVDERSYGDTVIRFLESA